MQAITRAKGYEGLLMQEYSPNWYWQQLGFTVERNGRLRTVFDQHGNEVCRRASYETELGIGRWLYDGTV